jgi:hypothetical protein
MIDETDEYDHWRALRSTLTTAIANEVTRVRYRSNRLVQFSRLRGGWSMIVIGLRQNAWTAEAGDSFLRISKAVVRIQQGQMR